jgi:hypothetical protein
MDNPMSIEEIEEHMIAQGVEPPYLVNVSESDANLLKSHPLFHVAEHPGDSVLSQAEVSSSSKLVDYVGKISNTYIFEVIV